MKKKELEDRVKRLERQAVLNKIAIESHFRTYVLPETDVVEIFNHFDVPLDSRLEEYVKNLMGVAAKRLPYRHMLY